MLEVLLFFGFSLFLIGMLILSTSHFLNENPIFGMIIIGSSIILQIGVIIVEPKYRKKEITHKVGNIIAIIAIIIQIFLASLAIYAIML